LLWSFTEIKFLRQQRILDSYVQEKLEEALFQGNCCPLEEVYFIESLNSL
jgi:hypothetical protein